jgi:hypothetical protein
MKLKFEIFEKHWCDWAYWESGCIEISEDANVEDILPLVQSTTRYKIEVVIYFNDCCEVLKRSCGICSCGICGIIGFCCGCPHERPGMPIGRYFGQTVADVFVARKGVLRVYNLKL